MVDVPVIRIFVHDQRILPHSFFFRLEWMFFIEIIELEKWSDSHISVERYPPTPWLPWFYQQIFHRKYGYKDTPHVHLHPFLMIFVSCAFWWCSLTCRVSQPIDRWESVWNEDTATRIAHSPTCLTPISFIKFISGTRSYSALTDLSAPLLPPTQRCASWHFPLFW